jgi:hypothetical protein
MSENQEEYVGTNGRPIKDIKIPYIVTIGVADTSNLNQPAIDTYLKKLPDQFSDIAISQTLNVDDNNKVIQFRAASLTSDDEKNKSKIDDSKKIESRIRKYIQHYTPPTKIKIDKTTVSKA